MVTSGMTVSAKTIEVVWVAMRSFPDFLPRTGERFKSVNRLDSASISDMTKTANDVQDLVCEINSDPKQMRIEPFGQQ